VLGVLVLYSDDPCFFDEEEIALLDGVAADISFALDALDLEEQRCHSEQIQQETLGKIEAILNASPLAIIALDVEGRVTAWNRASQEIFGWSADEIMGLPNPVVPESLRSEAKAIRTRVLLGEVYTGELRRHRKDGKLLDVSLSAAPLRNAERNTIGLMAMYADISERKRLEMQLWQAQKLESIGRMAGGLAHDFNNLLTVMNGHAELLLSRLGKSDPCWSNANEVLNAGMHAADLTHQLLAFSRQQVLQPKIISANAIISGMEGMLRRLVGEDVQLVTALDPTVGGVKVDPAQLQQVIMNLVVNARDASDAGGVITILTRNMKIAGLEATALASGPGEYVALSVSDTGEGMDEETQRHIFEPFFSTKPADKGTGLGLATVWGIVNQSGGHIRLESKPDLGTTFIILFPRVHEEVEPAESVHARPIPRGTGTILLVEDRDNVRQLTSEILTSCGYSVVQARDPAEAIELFQRRGTEFSLMISDVIMPGMSGPVLGEKVRLTRPDLKILYMSGHAGENVFGDRGLGRDAVFLQKPFSVMELAVAVQQILGVGVAEL
jgi:PAS domain S-box-containing protein